MFPINPVVDHVVVEELPVEIVHVCHKFHHWHDTQVLLVRTHPVHTRFADVHVGVDDHHPHHHPHQPQELTEQDWFVYVHDNTPFIHVLVSDAQEPQQDTDEDWYAVTLLPLLIVHHRGNVQTEGSLHCVQKAIGDPKQ